LTLLCIESLLVLQEVNVSIMPNWPVLQTQVIKRDWTSDASIEALCLTY
jgi:hypothetical protein